MRDCVALTLQPIPSSEKGVFRLLFRDSNLTFMKRLSYKSRDFYGFGSKSSRVGFCRNVSGIKNQSGLGFTDFPFKEDLEIDKQSSSDVKIERSCEEFESCEDDGFKEVSDTINELASAGVEFLHKNRDGLKAKTGRRRTKEGSLRSGRNVLKRSSLVAKQVISVQSAISLGFICQLWVSPNTWCVQVVEVRSSLLSGESERFLLKDVFRVGDVVLVRDESVMDIETPMISLETLVGYDVVTAGRRRIGKVRGYSFDINSGTVESLEIDSFGISIIPSSLVSTYVLLVEDVLDVLQDEIVVHESAASRLQRLTKGIWGSKSTKTINNVEDLYDIDTDMDQSPVPLEQARSRRKKSSRQKYWEDTNQKEDDWELPIDYL